MAAPKPVVLCILDGWGLSDATEANAPHLAKTPAFDGIMASCPHAKLTTHGPDVGLPKGQMGNSEVGHMNIGAGRVVAMDLGQIDLAIEDGTFFENDPLNGFIAALKASGGTAHIMGLVSDGGVHGSLDHMKAAVKAITDQGVRVVVHAITDGRDVAPSSAEGFVATLEAELPADATIGTVVGRYYAMDRDNRWDRVSRAYDAIIKGDAPHKAPTATSAVGVAYERGQTDEFIEATVLGDYHGVKDGDGSFCLNFRADRAREILAAIGDPDFSDFDTGPRPKLAGLLGMVEYSDAHARLLPAVFPKREIG